MTYKITSQCISCDRCISQCPTNAIKIVGDRHWIDPSLCNNCANTTYSVPQCAAGCPTFNGCVPVQDYWESWFATYDRLVGKLQGQSDYWERWFNTYSQKMTPQVQSHKLQPTT